MGQQSSKPDNPINPTENTQAFPEILKENEIKKLKKRFDKMDTNKNGKLSVEEIMTIPGLEHNPLVSRVIETFDTNNDGEINFMEFVQGISRFSVKTSKEDKLRFAFNIYDIDNDGFISNGELFTVLKIMVGENLDDINLQQIVDKTIVYADEDGDGKLSFEEFKKVIDKLNITERMTIEQIHQESSGNESEENERTSRGDDSDEDSEDHDSNRECVAARVVNKVRNVD